MAKLSFRALSMELEVKLAALEITKLNRNKSANVFVIKNQINNNIVKIFSNIFLSNLAKVQAKLPENVNKNNANQSQYSQKFKPR